MDPFLPYSIPVQGLKVGIHQFKYTLDNAFFRHFEGTPIEEGRVEVEMQLDKRSDMLLLDFKLDGYSEAECDRCTAQIHLPIQEERQLVVKYGKAESEEEEDEVIFISRDAPEINVARFMYEFAVLALPITNTYDCQNDPEPPCNQEVLKYLENGADESKSNPVWDALKGLK